MDLTGPPALNRTDYAPSFHWYHWGPDPVVLPSSAFSARWCGKRLFSSQLYSAIKRPARDHFTQDRLGTNIRKRSGRKSCSCRTGTLRSDATVKGAVVSVFAKGAYGGSAFNGTRCEKRPFSSHLNVKTIILPRQAQDQHRDNSKRRRFVQARNWTWRALGLPQMGD